jgi:Fe-S oxidoreductase
MEHCPANATGKELNPKEIILGLRGYLNEYGPKSEEPLLGKYNTQEAAFECTTCGACEFQCPVGIEHVPIIVGLRRGAVNTGAWDNDYGSKLFLALERGSNALGLSTTERDKFVEKNTLPIFDGTQEYCLWLGCMGGYDPRGREIVVALVRVMRHLGASFGVLRKEKCTGDPVRRLGNDLLFQQLAEANLEALAQNRVKKIITICPHCVRTIQEDWKEFGTPPEVEHHSEFLARHVGELSFVSGHVLSGSEETPSEDSLVSRSDFSRADSGETKNGALAPEPSRNEKIVFHDPCYLGRYRGVYDEPRQVAALAGELVEAPRSRERSFCCGAGGGLAFLGEEKGERVSHVRTEELIATGASVVAAACPFCNTMFRDALAARGEGAPELMDIAQLVARGLPEKQ